MRTYRDLSDAANSAYAAADGLVRAANRARSTLVQIKSYAETAALHAERGEMEEAEQLRTVVREMFDRLMAEDDQQLRAMWRLYFDRRGAGTSTTPGLESALFKVELDSVRFSTDLPSGEDNVQP